VRGRRGGGGGGGIRARARARAVRMGMMDGDIVKLQQVGGVGSRGGGGGAVWIMSIGGITSTELAGSFDISIGHGLGDGREGDDEMSDER
jgi:hypothetical protein